MMDSFVYEPLRSPDNIRVLRVTLSKSLELECELTEIELSEETQPKEAPPKYTALSYTWGDSSSTVPMLCNGKKIEITTNLAEALDMSVGANPNELLWVDQICINQNDIEEKGAQVRKMRLIYDRAQNVLAWIGPEREDTGLAVDLIKRVAGLTKGFGNDVFRDHQYAEERRKVETVERVTYEQAEELGVSFRDDAAWRAFSAFYDRPWFQRLWVVQEVLPAREAWITCGSHSVEWHQVKAAAAWYAYKTGLIKEKYDSARDVDGIAYSCAMNLGWRIRFGSEYLATLFDQKVRPTYVWAFDELLTTFRNRLAGDPRDKIYALLGISSVAFDIDTPLFAPDYSKSVMEVFRDATRGLIKYDSKFPSSLKILMSAVPRSQDPGWPSWVPDWRATNTWDVGGSLPESLNYSTSKNKHTYIAPEEGEENGLHVEGHILGTITHHSEHHHIGGLLSNTRSERDRCRQIYLDQFSTSIYTPTGDSVDTAWAMSIQGGQLFTEFEKKGTTPEQFGEILVDVIAAMTLPRSTPEESATRMEAVQPYMDKYGVAPGWLEYTQQMYCERRWFVTDTGYIGIGNWHLQEGDVVAELWGLDVSCILRPVAGETKEEGPRSYEFVGEAYCHGAKKAVEELDKDDEGISKGTKMVLV